MANIKIDFTQVVGKIKPLNGVNNGPKTPPRMFKTSGNFELYQALEIPFARTHDSVFFFHYGGDHTIDINAIFRDFDADVNDPASYDFACTDHYLQTIMAAGTEVFYRLGNSIDHRIKKYNSIPPADNEKWAKICEHIIAHYNEGWADGFYHNIKYWEIWGEPENGSECWDGPYEDFLPFFAIVAKHLKQRFPNIKVGGPGFATFGVLRKSEEFLTYMKERDVPIDFFSWHAYRSECSEYQSRIFFVRELLDRIGYTETENVLGEWAYMQNWKEGRIPSIKTIISMKGAAFVSANMAMAQKYPLDMMLYYDARPNCTLNCLFYFYTDEPLKGYYTFKLFSLLRRLGQSVEIETDREDIYAVAATDGENNAVMVTYFTNDEEAKQTEICLKMKGGAKQYAALLLDDDHDGEQVALLDVINGELTLKVAPNTVWMLQSTDA